ncbi:Nif3-like dinuclear metal center hexameric protein [Methanofollis formosanus]|uniref:Nif3-like dinuclear metal center hexameric protein n=1 Tax=Methanofollis formosanus TaxID=299308 RepID=A0A8G1A0R8_9EURY|nr:Nif3-like dinuclear metal center hexameric protein [Methanofollis formosanus]QYZ78311.1 Nif3-like dinuclear metal center hexameric protein [Methanofollis formosanus]
MHIADLVARLEEIAPPDLAEEFDEGRIGLIVEGREEIDTVCCALDATPAVAKNAAAMGADLLVVHHTPLWTPVTGVRGQDAKVLAPLLGHGINLYVMHTNFDRAPGGVNDTLAEILGLEETERMSLGVVGRCTLPLAEMVERIGGNVRFWGEAKDPGRLGVVGGSGFDPDLIEEAVALGADAFLSAELKHHVARTAPVPCIESTHYALEAPAMEALALREGWEYIGDAPRLTTLP